MKIIRYWTPDEINFVKARLHCDTADLAAKLGRTVGSVNHWIMRHGGRPQEVTSAIRSKNCTQNLAGKVGIENPNWKGGVSKDNMRYRRRQLERYPERDAARKAVSNAIRSGKLTKQSCACGSPEAQAHHDDYSKPLDVRWLCRPCHLKEHGGVWNSEHPTLKAA